MFFFLFSYSVVGGAATVSLLAPRLQGPHLASPLRPSSKSWPTCHRSPSYTTSTRCGWAFGTCRRNGWACALSIRPWCAEGKEPPSQSQRPCSRYPRDSGAYIHQTQRAYVSRVVSTRINYCFRKQVLFWLSVSLNVLLVDHFVQRLDHNPVRGILPFELVRNRALSVPIHRQAGRERSVPSLALYDASCARYSSSSIRTKEKPEKQERTNN